MDPLLPPFPRVALVCDARAPLAVDGRVAWRQVGFLNGDGRGDVNDWLAVGGAPDASPDAPLLTDLWALSAPGLSAGDLLFLDGVRAVRLPRAGEWSLARRWPVAWRDSEIATGMAEDVARWCPGARAPLALAFLRASDLAGLCPAAFDDAVAAVEGRGEASSLELRYLPRRGSAFSMALAAAKRAVAMAVSWPHEAPGRARAAAEAAAQARAVRRHGPLPFNDLRWTEQSADVAREIRAAVPWHDLLRHLVAAGDVAPWPPRAVERTRCETSWGHTVAADGSVIATFGPLARGDR